MEGAKIRRGVGSDVDVGETLLGSRGVAFAVFETEGGCDWVAAAVVESNGGVGDGSVAGRDEGGTDAIADEVAFSVDGVEIHGELSAEGVEDGAGRDSGDMRGNGGEGGAEGNFLEERIRVDGRKRRERDGGRGRAGTKGHGSETCGFGDGSDGGVGELHGRRGGESRGDKAIGYGS